MKLPSFGCEEWLNVHEKEATYDLAQSTISSLTMDEFINLCGLNHADFYHELNLKKMNYGWIEGSNEFKEEVSKLYNHVQPSMVLATNGCTGANLLAICSLIEPSDHVIAMYPSYQQLYDLPKGLGAEVSYLKLDEKLEWMPHIDELKKLIRPNTKMICINNANNPTGTILDHNCLNEIVKIADSVGAYILCDEVYKPMEDVDVPSIVDIYDKGIATNSLSKTFSLPGIRVGWIVANDEITNIFRLYRDYTMICCGVLDDYIGSIALQNEDKILKRNYNLIHKNLTILKEWVEKEPRASLIVPKHVSVSFVKIEVPIDIEEFCTNLLKDTGVLLIPGNCFKVEGYVRLGYCTNTQTLVNGLNILSNYLRQYD